MNKKTTTILIVILFIFLFLWFFWVLKNSSPQKTKTENFIFKAIPGNNDSNIPIDRNIYFYSEKPLKIGEITIKSSPEFKFSIFSENGGKIIKVKPLSYLEKNTNYKITLSSKKIKNSPLEIGFETGDIIESALKQDDALILTLKKKIPVFSTYFDLSYVEEKEAFAVVINSSDCQKAKDEVLNYLKINGVNPDEARIIWYAGGGVNASCVPVR